MSHLLELRSSKKEKILPINLEADKEDIRRFIQNPKEIDGWSKEFFLSLLPMIKIIP
ncbi:MAG: hypothetical protein JSS09_03400 [Verrucomicrobia bacterium]|nr:hypothetical protein [Verrucomicrobiota bacterium]